MNDLRYSEDMGASLQDNMTDKQPPDTPRPMFTHSPLNHQKPSIRLIRIRPELSSEGYLQCDIRHATTDSTYTCLSYVWGDEHCGEWTVLDDRRFWIRKNLWDFLREASKMPHIQCNWLWIDALCIDQNNNAERTHQVHQMGRIYSGAARVIAWLGPNERIAEYLESLLKWSESTSGAISFRDCEYWNRAWITQEVALAQRLTIMAGGVEKDESVIDFRNQLHFSSDGRPLSYPIRKDGHNSLLKLIGLFHAKKCSIPHDRVYSLLSLCDDVSWLEVDYKKSVHQLARDILRNSSEGICFCTMHILDRALQLSDHAHLDVDEHCSEPFVQMKLHLDYDSTLENLPFPGSACFSSASGNRQERTVISTYLVHICQNCHGTLNIDLAARKFEYVPKGKRWGLRSGGFLECTIEPSGGLHYCIISLWFRQYITLAAYVHREFSTLPCEKVGKELESIEYNSTVVMPLRY
jgi:hypothetical protein